MIDGTGKLWLRIFSLLLIVPMICTGCKRIVEDSPVMAEEEDARQDLIHIMGTYEDIYKGDAVVFHNIILGCVASSGNRSNG